MIAVLQAAFLGVVQGLTEFIPVSSSGHLVIIPKLFGWSDPGLAFDVAVHIGTLLAIIVYFRREWLMVVKGFFTSLTVRPSKWDRGQRLAWMLILATVPAAIAGAALEGYFSDHMRSLASVAVFLTVGALAMATAETFAKGSRGFEGVRVRDAGAMGIVQIAALAPGLSRSGVTMSAGMLTGLDREAAARFSFMMAAPITAGAGLVECAKIMKNGTGSSSAGTMIAGFVTAAVVGFFTVKYLLGYLKRGTLMPFALYSIVVAFAIFLLLVLT